jgi:peptidyl-tRNA hydrolase
MHKLYVVVRNDLDPGLQMAQAIHAALEYAKQILFEKEKLPENVIVLQVPDEEALKKLAYSMSHEFVELFCFTEPDLGHQLTSISCSSFSDGSGTKVERFVGSLPRALREFAFPKAA